eukprot:CAMPEP_0204588658 /NCGR_PEP_ID=MMETSP0661-20131031/48745_1 /ASSEMBLY_ACC=CAM_ASM_000606 /TAXON_ID=109239 /ORGANISM="Alexandrium margalefi, Strain AMGDE01CS-322" /LENGTH=34 /DNA_ID= /DNA_START= /DNA_END= /DNA_ORIENTATION=
MAIPAHLFSCLQLKAADKVNAKLSKVMTTVSDLA